MRPTLALAVLLAACGGSSKPAPAEPAPEVAAAPPVDDVDTGGEEWGPEESEERDDSQSFPYAPGVVPPLDQASVDAGGSGSLICDELITRTMCTYKMAGAAVPVEAIKAFEDGTKYWIEALQNDATRAATMEACKMSVDAGKPSFEAVGC